MPSFSPNHQPTSCRAMTTGMARCDESSWREFQARYFDWLYSQALVRCPSEGDAAEIVQLTCLRIVRHIKAFEQDSEFKNWLKCLMRCVVIDQARQISRRSLLMEKFTLWQELRKHNSTKQNPDHRETVGEMLSSLPHADATLVQLKYIDGWSTKELAEKEKTTAKAIESRLGRLRKKLQTELGNTQERKTP